MLSRLYGVDPLYGLLLTFGLALILEGAFRYWFGAAGKPYAPPAQLTGGAQSRLHVHADLPRLGGRRVAGRSASAPGF